MIFFFLLGQQVSHQIQQKQSYCQNCFALNLDRGVLADAWSYMWLMLLGETMSLLKSAAGVRERGSLLQCLS